MFERFRTGTQSQQVKLIFGAVCTIALILTAIWAAFFRTSYQTLFSDLRAEDAASIVAELDRKKIPYRLEDGGSAILVPSDLVDGARLDVRSENGFARGTVGFELFNKSDMGLTDFAQRINYQRALQGELARTIMTFDDVESVRVHLSLGEDRIFRDDQVAPKASVMIRTKKGAVLTEAAAVGIRQMVAAAVPRLEAANVVVLDEQGRTVAVRGAPSLSDELDIASTERRAVEEFYEARIRSAVSEIEPSISAAVTIALEKSSGVQRLAEWSLKTRDFPLQIAVLSAAKLPSDTQEKVRALAVKAVAASEPQADSISFGVRTPVAADRVQISRSPVVDTRGAIATPHRTIGSQWAGAAVWILAGGLALLLSVVMLWTSFLSRPKRLSEQRQQDFAVRLRAALNEGGNGVTSV